ncbi:DNA (cytosine-5-)-methyltransferase [Nostoc sp. KVJ3]|uniref:DNA cytosine methyltransferase n=1 Tax=Nostoc sp. KVJ3 TaxID=457945 RepID=UPI00223A67CA|nr:DNA (cytosine-5-)-methyltransferase [Nostoc sp. KVJ3]
MSKLTALDLCSGVGAGFPFAMLQLGFNLIGVSEIDEYCSGILSKRFPDVCNYGDVRSLPVRDIRKQWGEIDVVTASPPCQPFSVQGKRQGEDDPRDCFPAVKRAIESIRPKFFCIENVPGLLTCRRNPSSQTLYLQHFLRQVAKLGYDAEWLCVGSGHFASPYLRERLLLVGISRGVKLDWERATPWPEQARSTIETARTVSQRRGIKTGFPTQWLQSPALLPRPLGLPSRNATTRRMRQAAGNLFDPRVAAIALNRIVYLNSLCRDLYVSYQG